MSQPDWFRALLDSSPDVYFRYSLQPARQFVYLSPSISALTGHAPQAFYDDAKLCLGLIVREDRRLLKEVLRARRGLTLTVRFIRGGTVVPVTLRTATVIRQRHIVAIEGVVATAVSSHSRVGPAAGPTLGANPGGLTSSKVRAGVQLSDASTIAPAQQHLAALMYEVHDLLHRVLPPMPAARRAGSELRVGDLVLDSDRMTVTEQGIGVSLTTREILVLRYFLQHPGRVVSRTQLLSEVWGYSYTGDDRTVDVHISRIRRKLPSVRARLVAVKHVGYRLDMAEPDTALTRSATL